MHQVAELFERGVLGAAAADAARGVLGAAAADAARGVLGAAAADAAPADPVPADPVPADPAPADVARGVLGAAGARGVEAGVEAGVDVDREVDAEAAKRDDDILSFLRWRNASSDMARFSRDLRTLFMRACPGMSCERSMMSKSPLAWLAMAVESGSTSQTNSSDMSSSDPRRSEIELASLESDRCSSCRSSVVGADIVPVLLTSRTFYLSVCMNAPRTR